MIVVLLLVLGLSLGSFVNALVWRLHEQEKSKGKNKKLKAKSKKLSAFSFRPSANRDMSILSGRSMCTHCKHQLAAKDLIPLVSWLALGGKCRYCKKPIGSQYPIVEALTAGLFVASYIWWPMRFDTAGIVNFVVWLIMLVGFMALSLYDLRWLILPNRILYPMIVLAAALAILNATVFDGGVSLVRNTVFSIAIGGGFFYGLFELSKGKWIGGGDVKLGLLLGFLLASPAQAFLALFTASLIGTAVVVPGIVGKRLTAKSRIPFGPFLIVATIIIKLFGVGIIEWYKRQFLLI